MRENLTRTRREARHSFQNQDRHARFRVIYQIREHSLMNSLPDRIVRLRGGEKNVLFIVWRGGNSGAELLQSVRDCVDR